MTNKTQIQCDTCSLTWLGTVLVILKLSGVLDLYWWVVTSPFWLQGLAIIAILFVVLIIFAAEAIAKIIKENNRK